MFLQNSHIWEKSGFWDVNENVVGHSECRVTISLVQIYEIAWFLYVYATSSKLKVDQKVFGW